MAYFIIILMVFVTAYGVTLQVILYPNSPLQFSLIDDIFKKAYFQIYGELFLDELEGTLTCEATPTANSTLPRCPENTLFVPKTLLAFYILFTNVLMLNLLIAMFSYTFNKIETNTDEHWSFEQYFLIKEYHDRPPVPPPFIILNQIYRLFRCLCNKCDPKKVENNFAMTYPEPLDRELTVWENINVGEYVRQTQIKRQQSLDSRVKETQDRVETIAHKLEDSNLSPRRPISASHVS
ncbi:Transient receptor potential cation channel subfamily M member 2, partial [Lamellibrachia satsuma]